MSFDGVRKRRRIVQKLDFENCIVTNLKTSARGKKKLRARITREFEHFCDIPERSELCDSSPIVDQSTPPSSPVLIRKQYRNGGSSVNTKRKNPNSVDEDGEKLSEHSTIEEVPSSPGSPVFKTYKKHKTANVSIKTIQKEPDASGMFDNQEDSSFGMLSSFEIDDFTQESKQSVKISSVESPVKKSDTSESYSGESSVRWRNSPTQKVKAYEECKSPKPLRRNYKKSSLLARLRKLQQKQASEKLLWQHQNRKNLSNTLTVSIVNFWQEEFNYFIKCRSCSADFETTFLIIDSRWVPNIKNVKDGSVLQLHPPWQKLSPEGTTMTVLLSVTCLDILDGIKDPIVQEKTTSHAIVTVDQFETEPKLFIDSLFSSCCSGFLC